MTTPISFLRFTLTADEKPLEQLDHSDRCFPGLEAINLAKLFGTLKEMNYNGMVSVETFRPNIKKDLRVIKTSYEYTKKI